MILLVLACGSDPGAKLDEDNWLDGSFVDEYGPTVTAVEIEMASDLSGVDITYLDGDAEVLAVRVTGGMPDQGDELGRARDGYVMTDLVDVDDGPQNMSFQWTLDGDTMTGSFESEFTVVNSGNLYVEGAFSGAVNWE